MYKFKAFDSTECGDSMSALEAMVNAWMESEQPRVRHMAQTMRGESILLSFVYEETKELELRVATEAQTSTTGSFPHFFDDVIGEEHPTSPRIPATPPPMH